MVGAPTARTPVVLVTEWIEVARSRSAIEDRLSDRGCELLSMASGATEEGEGFIVKVGPSVGRHFLGVPVEVQLGPRFTRDGSAAIPIRWKAVAFESLFPVLDGTILLRALDEDRTSVGIEASYRVPLRGLGELLDRTLLHRVAESTIRSFLTRFAASFAAVD